MEFAQLWQEYQRLLRENGSLRKENEALRLQLNVPNMPAQTPQVSDAALNTSPDTATAALNIVMPSLVTASWPPVHNKSAPAHKIACFMALFCGRADVYAKRWHSPKTGKSGYQPACANEWSEGLCDKRTYKCNACPNRILLPLDEQGINQHLRGNDAYGRDVIGIYPMLADERCRLLVVDFDDESFQADAAAFLAVCQKHGVPASIERSRSGNGAHIWIFFAEPISATLARRLGSGLLTYAMHCNVNLTFRSYDRLFPNQDNMPFGGFGNLIALPLQGLARKSGNSVFVDDTFEPYPDQWAYLSTVQKLLPTKAEQLVATLCAQSDLGALLQSNCSDDSDCENTAKPWERRSSKSVLTKENFPDELVLTEANLLFVPTAGLSPAAQNQVKRLAAFRNPEFYRAQAMRLPIYEKPRVIATAEVTPDYIGLPRGTKPALLQLLADVNVSVQLEDKRYFGKAIQAEFTGTLREEQQLAADAMLAHDTGVLSATTAFGKTVIAAYMIAQRKVNTLILVHTQALLTQWKKALAQFLELHDVLPAPAEKSKRKKLRSLIGQLGGGKHEVNGIIDIAVMQSLTAGDEVKPLVREYGMVIVDECHHVSAVNFEKILRETTAHSVYGLTATPIRQDGHHPIIHLQCGPIRYRVDAKVQAQKRAFSHFVIPRFTPYRNISAQHITKLYTDLAQDSLRNQMIVRDVTQSIREGRNPIILTERTEHVSILAQQLTPECSEIIVLTGSQTAKEKRAVTERLDRLPSGSAFVIIATGKYVGEGFDFPRLDTLFLALPIAWKGKVSQYAGRLHRAYQGKQEVQIYDYVDVHVPVLERMYHKRVTSYAAIGYKTKALEQTAEGNLIFDSNSFLVVFCADLSKAKNEIVIVSPFMRKSRLTQMVNALSAAMINSVKITVVTRPESDYKESDRAAVVHNAAYLRAAHIKVVFRSNIHQKFAIIDRQLVWYGSINLLSFGTSEESIMRLQSLEIANELLGGL